MYAIIEVGGRQWKVEPGTRLDINRVATAVGGRLPVDRVLLAHDGQSVQIGRPYVPGAQVVCEVLEHRFGPKEISYHFRRRENWRKTVGHRQPLTRLVVKDIVVGGGSQSAAAAVAPQPHEAKPRAPRVHAAKPATVKAQTGKTAETKPRSKPATTKPKTARG